MTGDAHALIPMESDKPEIIIWHNDIRHWFHIIQQEMITNQNIILKDFKNNKVYRVPIMEVNPIVMNSHSYGYGLHYTVGTGRYVRNYVGMSQYHGQHIGDLVFMRSGVPVITYRQIQDPQGVRNMVIAIQHGHYT
jgi:hypothetical protein